eukprot:Transcript_19765.p1 GENE.Transcript_19765~~Transcript_19765.p1  ORF type:complete len:263 (-),score=78.78 Transcript_19765:320-1108(-)
MLLPLLTRALAHHPAPLLRRAPTLVSLANHPATTALWLEDTFAFEATASVLEAAALEDGEGLAVVLDASPFHPQGGGQPSDVGTIVSEAGASLDVRSVRMDRGTGVVVHEVAAAEPLAPGERVRCVVEEATRTTAARVHSAGHLIDTAMARCDVGEDVLKPTKGYHFAEGAYVEYAGALSVEEREALLPRLQAALDQLVEEALPVEVSTADDGGRVVSIGGVGCGCGGTHVSTLDQIGRVTLKAIKKKGKALRVSYSVGDKE